MFQIVDVEQRMQLQLHLLPHGVTQCFTHAVEDSGPLTEVSMCRVGEIFMGFQDVAFLPS